MKTGDLGAILLVFLWGLVAICVVLIRKGLLTRGINLPCGASEYGCPARRYDPLDVHRIAAHHKYDNARDPRLPYPRPSGRVPPQRNPSE